MHSNQIEPNPEVQLLTSIYDSQNGFRPVALTQGSREIRFPSFWSEPDRAYSEMHLDITAKSKLYSL